ncbi:MAG: DKNYY domain-containing protein [Candidatus Taylorbacteria bacterium]
MKKLLFAIAIFIIIILVIIGYLYLGKDGFRNIGIAVFYSTQCSSLDVCIEANTITRIPEANPLFFKIIDSHIAKDNEHVYYINHIVNLNIDAKTFKQIGEGYYGGRYTYFKDKNNIYYINANNNGLAIIQGADIDTFEVMPNGTDLNAIPNSLFAKDKNQIYYASNYNEIISCIILQHIFLNKEGDTGRCDSTSSSAFQ